MERIDLPPSARTRENPRTVAATATDPFEALILPHIDSLYGPAYRLTRSATDAEDLVQETLLRAYTRFASFRAGGSAKAWLHTIMRNLFINSYRKKTREPRQVSFESLEEPGSTRPTTSSPERVVLSQMEEAALLRAVAGLPAEYRTVVLLADLEGHSYQEIADSLSIPVGTVRSRLSRGRKRVQRALFAWRGDTPPLPA